MADEPAPVPAPEPAPVADAAPAAREPSPPETTPGVGTAPPAPADPAAPAAFGEGLALEGDAAAAGREPAPAPPAAPALPRRRSPLGVGLAFAWRSKRVLLLVVVVQVLFGLSIALPFRARIGAYLDHHAHASAFAGTPDDLDRATGWPEGLDWGVLADAKRREAPFLDGLMLALVWIGVLAWLFGQAVAGGFLATAAEDLGLAVPAPSAAGASPPGRTARFLAGAGRWLFPTLRVSLVFLALTMLVGRRVVFEVWGGIAGDAEAKSASQAVGWWGARQREAVFLGLFLVLRAAADLGRAHLVVRGRRSAVLAFFRGLATLLRHPWKAGGLAVLVAVPEMLLLFALAGLMARFPGGSFPHVLGALLVLEAAVLVRWAARAALLAGNVGLLEPRPLPAQVG